jgi:hypothetical protein
VFKSILRKKAREKKNIESQPSKVLENQWGIHLLGGKPFLG